MQQPMGYCERDHDECMTLTAGQGRMQLSRMLVITVCTSSVQNGTPSVLLR